jgi:hypothetical protein
MLNEQFHLITLSLLTSYITEDQSDNLIVQYQ